MITDLEINCGYINPGSEELLGRVLEENKIRDKVNIAQSFHIT